MAGTTRLELATSAVTGRRSNQLNYVPRDIEDPAIGDWTIESGDWVRLAIVTSPRLSLYHQSRHLAMEVGGTGIEPVTAGV